MAESFKHVMDIILEINESNKSSWIQQKCMRFRELVMRSFQWQVFGFVHLTSKQTQLFIRWIIEAWIRDSLFESRNIKNAIPHDHELFLYMDRDMLHAGYFNPVRAIFHLTFMSPTNSFEILNLNMTFSIFSFPTLLQFPSIVLTVCVVIYFMLTYGVLCIIFDTCNREWWITKIFACGLSGTTPHSSTCPLTQTRTSIRDDPGFYCWRRPVWAIRRVSSGDKVWNLP